MTETGDGLRHFLCAPSPWRFCHGHQAEMAIVPCFQHNSYVEPFRKFELPHHTLAGSFQNAGRIQKTMKYFSKNSFSDATKDTFFTSIKWIHERTDKTIKIWELYSLLWLRYAGSSPRTSGKRSLLATRRPARSWWLRKKVARPGTASWTMHNHKMLVLKNDCGNHNFALN